MVHIHEEDLELYTEGRLDAERISIAESHLVECESCRRLLADWLVRRLARDSARMPAPSTEQKRTEPRFGTEGEAILQELHPISFDRHIVKVVNVSRNGFGILSPKAILPGTIVRLRIKDTIELASVRHCSALEDARFRIGLRLHSEG